MCSLLPDHTHYLDAQAKDLRPNDEDDDDSDNDYSDDEELQSPIDEVDPFIFFVDTVKAMQTSDPLGSRTLHRRLTSIIKHLLMVLPNRLNKGK